MSFRSATMSRPIGSACGWSHFAAPARRGAFTVNDLAQAHEGGMDSFARRLKDVRRLIDDGEMELIDIERRASWESGVAKSISDGDEDFSSLEP